MNKIINIKEKINEIRENKKNTKKSMERKVGSLKRSIKSTINISILWQQGREGEERLISAIIKQRKTGVGGCYLETRGGSPHPRG
jgi:hypothetical protein